MVPLVQWRLHAWWHLLTPGCPDAVVPVPVAVVPTQGQPPGPGLAAADSFVRHASGAYKIVFVLVYCDICQ